MCGRVIDLWTISYGICLVLWLTYSMGHVRFFGKAYYKVHVRFYVEHIPFDMFGSMDE